MGMLLFSDVKSEGGLLGETHFKRPLSNHISRTTTTVLQAATPACCVTATRWAPSPELVTERAASVSVNPVSLDASVTAVTTPSLRFLLMAVKV